MKNTITQGYKITTDDSFLEKIYPTPKGLEEKMPKLYEMAYKGKAAGVDLILKEIKRYPKYPDLKTLLSLLYAEMGRQDKADEIQLKLAKEHPEYFTGRLNAAFIHFDNEEYHLMEEVLSKGFDLKTMYPEREGFHIQEVALIQKAAVFYYGAVGDIDQAKIRLEIMEKSAPDSEDVQIAEDQLNINILHHRLRDSKENSPLNVVREAFSKINTLVKQPKFHFEIIHELFEYGSDIPQGLIEEIMELPRKKVIADLEAVIKHSIDNFESISKYPVEEYKMFYVSHAIYLLADLEAFDSLPIVLEVYKQDDDYNDYYFGDFITDITWDPLMRLSRNNLAALMEYMKLPAIYTYNRAVIPEALEQIVYHYPEKKEKVLSFFEELLAFYLNTDDPNCIDEELNGLIVWTLTDFGEPRFKLLVSAMFDRNMVDEGIVGVKGDVLALFDQQPLERKNELLSLPERYDLMFHRNDEFDEEKFEQLVRNIASSPTNQKEDVKIQRNDPCPCGSGKKHKKCCLNG